MADVRLVDVRKRYGPVTAVDGVSLAVARGEFVAILGPSGCGKTTLLRLIAGLARVSGGQILIGERDMTEVPPNRRDVGIVFQNYALFPHLSVAQNVAFGLQMRHVPRAEVGRRVAEALALVGLAGFAGRWPHELSGGEQQRVAVARALVIQPTVLLLDEPLAALDKGLRQRMQVELRALQRQVGITTLFVTHDQDEALTMADRVAVMHRGQIEQVDAPTAIYEAPRSAFVLNFLGRANSFAATVTKAGGDGVWLRTASGLWLLSTHPDGPCRGELVAGVRPEHVVLLPDDAAGRPNVYAAEPVTTIFHGAFVEHHLRLRASGETVVCQTAGGAGGGNAREATPGGPIHVHFPPEAVLRVGPSPGRPRDALERQGA